MMNDGTMESRLARVEQRVSDLDQRVNSLAPTASQVVQLTEWVKTLQRDMTGVQDLLRRVDQKFEQQEKDREDREEQSRKERKSDRRALYSLTAAIIGLLIAALPVLIALAGGH